MSILNRYNHGYNHSVDLQLPQGIRAVHLGRVGGHIRGVPMPSKAKLVRLRACNTSIIWYYLGVMFIGSNWRRMHQNSPPETHQVRILENKSLNMFETNQKTKLLCQPIHIRQAEQHQDLLEWHHLRNLITKNIAMPNNSDIKPIINISIQIIGYPVLLWPPDRISHSWYKNDIILILFAVQQIKHIPESISELWFGNYIAIQLRIGQRSAGEVNRSDYLEATVWE